MRIDFGLLLLRVATGVLMLMGHGWGKLMNFAPLSLQFPDPIGIGAMPTLVIAVFAEVFCSMLVILGLATRFATVPLMATMLSAAVIVHADDPWSKKEFALLYLIPFLTLFIMGPGAISIDGVIRSRPGLFRP